MRPDQFDRAFRLLAIILIGELLWLSWLKAEGPARRPRLRFPPCEVEARLEPEEAPATPIVAIAPVALEGEILVDDADLAPVEGFSVNRDPESEEEVVELRPALSMGSYVDQRKRDPAEVERERHPPPPCEIEVIGADGEPKSACAVIVLGPEDQASELTWTNSAGMARVRSSGASADVLIDSCGLVHREQGVRLVPVRHRIVIPVGVEISGSVILDDRAAGLADDLAVEIVRAEEPPMVKEALKAHGLFWSRSGSDLIVARLDDRGRFSVSGFQSGWKGHVRLRTTSYPREVVTIAAVTAPSSNVVLRAPKPTPVEEEKEER